VLLPAAIIAMSGAQDIQVRPQKAMQIRAARLFID
jgi:hypothetical protein